MKTVLRYRAQRGWLLIELLIATGISVAALLGGLVMWQKGTFDNSMTTALQRVQLVKEAVEGKWFVDSGYTYAGLSSANLVAGRYLPQEMVDVAGTGLSHGAVVGNNTIVVAPETGNLAYRITYTSLDVPACQSVATQSFWMMTSIQVNGTTIKTATTNAINPAAIRTACNAASNLIRWSTR